MRVFQQYKFIHTFITCSIAIVLWTLVGQAKADKQTLVFGLLPAETPVALFKRFAPLRDYISNSINKEVQLETARDFVEFAKRTATRHYDIVFTAPHMAIPALDSGQYELSATFAKPLKAVIVTSEKSSLNSIDQLAGKHIATPPKQAIITMVGTNFLNSHPAIANNPIRYTDYRSHNAAYRAALAGEVNAAMIANFIYYKAKKQKAGLRLLASSEGFPGIGILVAADLSEDLKVAISTTLVHMKDQAKGKLLLKKISQPGYAVADIKQFEILRSYVLDNSEKSNEVINTSK